MSLTLVSIAVDTFRKLKYSKQRISRSSIQIIKDEIHRKELKGIMRCPYNWCHRRDKYWPMIF